MSTEEQEKTLGKAVVRLRAKKTEQRCLQSKANDLARALGEVLQLHKSNKHDGQLSLALDALPANDEIVRVFRELIQAEADIEELKQTLEL